MYLILVSILVTILIMGGPLTLFVAVKVISSILGGVRPKFVRLRATNPDDPTLGLLVQWDPQTYEEPVSRVRADFTELVQGGRATTFSFTFEDRSAKKRSFVIPMKLKPEDYAMLTDNGVPSRSHSLNNSYVIVEVENTKGEVVRKKISKKCVRKALAAGPMLFDSAEVDVLPPTSPDAWSVLTRVFPWRKAVAAAAAAPAEKKAAKKEAKAGPSLVDFLVTKVWIEPGCIVCDACENEAPSVFKVLPDTAIVVDNAPLTDGGAIKAAAEGCPVNVIKYTSVPKAAG